MSFGSRPVIRGAVLLGAALVAGLACQRDESPPPSLPERKVPIEEKLAQRAVEEPTPPRELPVSDAPPVRAGALELSVRKVSTQQAVKGGTVTLTSEEVFLTVELVLLNVTASEAPLNLRGALVKTKSGQRFELARDAQVLVGRRDLELVVRPEERQRALLVFELPESAIGPGLTLVIPGAEGRADEVLPLQ